MNDTIGENDGVPSLLVFRNVPRFPIISTEIPSKRERMQILSAAQMEMSAIVAERGVLAALNRNILPATIRVYTLGDEILVFSEQEKQWLGPSLVCNVHGRMITAQNVEGSYRQTFNTYQIKPYYAWPESIVPHQTVPFRSKAAPNLPHDVLLTKIIPSNDPRAQQFDMVFAFLH